MTGRSETIQTALATASIALITIGVQQIAMQQIMGYVTVSFGTILQFVKYYGKNKKIW